MKRLTPSKSLRGWGFGLACVGVWGAVSTAQAASCEGLSDSVLITGSSALRPLLAELGRLLEVQRGDDSGLRLYYSGGGSCDGVSAVLNPSSFAPESLQYWDASGDEITCELELGSELPQVIGLSDVFAGSCVALPNGLPSNVADFPGPVQPMVFATPAASTETVISAEAAYYVFGFGDDSGVSPWTEAEQIFHRNAQSGTQTMIASAIGVPAGSFRGTETSGTSVLLQRLQGTPAEQADATIGIVSAHSAESNRSSVNTLAFQDFGASCGALPNATATSNEKAHVRDGSYPIWGPIHMLTAVDEDRRPVDAAADTVLSFLLGTAPVVPGLDLIQLQAEQHLVPQCAMRVTRTHEMAPPQPFLPEQPCGCYYDLVTNGQTDCASCTTNAQCAAGELCSNGYCEVLSSTVGAPTASSVENEASSNGEALD